MSSSRQRRPWAGAGLFFAGFLIFILFAACPARAGARFSDKELLAAGQMWTETKVQWTAEKSVHRRRMKQIRKMKLSQPKKDFLRAQEIARHRSRNNILAAKRDQVQNVLITEANARVKGGKTAASGGLKDTAGTKFGEAGHRGMPGDRDMGAGARTVDKVEDVLKDMGIYNSKHIKKTAATLEIGDDFELTINKEGIKPRPGTEYHQVKTNVDARNPETYVSESMKTRRNGQLVQKEVGADYVEVQDHRKKASKGLATDGEGLVRNQGKMQSMAKGTGKTLDMGAVDDETLGKILKQNGIHESPKAYKKKLWAIKEQTLRVTNAQEAAKMRRVSEDVFNAAERSTLAKAKKNIVDLRAKAASMDPADPTRAKIEDEIVDSVTKMKATKAANEEFISHNAAKSRPAPPPDAPEVKGKITAADTDVELAKVANPDTPTVRQKAAKAFGTVMTISDIGQTCQTIEDWQEGKISLGEASLTVVDAFVTQGLIGTGKHAYQSHKDYTEARDKINQANRTNMTAYLDQWRIRLRKAGLSKQEARSLVGRAIISGDLNVLRKKSRELRDEGRDIKDPVLITETFEADDTKAERAWEVLKGVAVGTVKNIGYIVTAPSRVVEAYAEGELAEANLDAYARTRSADSRKELFRKLISAGVDSHQALKALNQYEDNNTAPLRALFKEARERVKAEQAAAAEAAAAAEEARRIEAEANRRAALLRSYSAHVTYLMTTPLKLEYRPAPVQLEREGERELIELTVTDKRGKLQAVIKSLDKVIEELSGSPGKVKVDYKFSCPVKPGRKPGQFFTKSPGVEGVYPVEASLDFHIQGPGLEGDMAALDKVFTRREFGKVEVTALEKKFDYSQGAWPELRKTDRVVVTQKHMGTYIAEQTPTGRMAFTSENRYSKDKRRKTDVSITFGADGKTIKEVFLEQTFYDASGKVENMERYSYQNLRLYDLETETPTRPTMAYYVSPGKETNYVYGTYQGTYLDNGVLKWGKVLTAGNISINKNVKVHVTNMYIHCYMSDQKRAEKEALKKKLYKEKKAAQQVQRDKAQGGLRFEGPFAEKEGFTGQITINIGQDHQSVQGTFKAHREAKTSKREVKALLTGEFLGVINPDTGQMEAKVNKSNMMTLIKKEGKWWPTGLGRSMSKDTKVIGQLKGGTLTGHLELKKRKGFAWTAKPVVEKDAKEKKQ